MLFIVTAIKKGYKDGAGSIGAGQNSDELPWHSTETEEVAALAAIPALKRIADYTELHIIIMVVGCG